MAGRFKSQVMGPMWCENKLGLLHYVYHAEPGWFYSVCSEPLISVEANWRAL
jgi:hypothetical protein